jgi:hypothetical protein
VGGVSTFEPKPHALPLHWQQLLSLGSSFVRENRARHVESFIFLFINKKYHVNPKIYAFRIERYRASKRQIKLLGIKSVKPSRRNNDQINTTDTSCHFLLRTLLHTLSCSIMRPCKVQRQSVAQQSIKDTAPAAKMDPLNQNAIPEELQHRFLSFLLARPVPAKFPRNLFAKIHPFDSVRDDYRSLSLVSKSWRIAVGDYINNDAPYEIVSPRELTALKSKVFALDLTGLYDVFLKLARAQWPVHIRQASESGIYYDTDSLETVIDQLRFHGVCFAKMVADEYKQFLVIKCVKILASDCSSGLSEVNIWLQSIQPCKLVELFWQAHCLGTSKHCMDCQTLFGKVIDFSGLHEYI